MTEKKVSQLQKDYRIFFLGKLEEYGVNSPAVLSKVKKSEFFSAIKDEWAKIKSSKTQSEKSIPKENNQYATKKNKDLIPKKSHEPNFSIASTETGQGLIKQVIKSEPNKNQTDDLKIFFVPNKHFEQNNNKYFYPVVKMPILNSSLKLPRLGRSNQKGYKENDFFEAIKSQITNIEISNDFHLVIPNYNKPYEPDISLYDKKLNLYIDIEIDEPYDGFYRYPTHNYKAENDFKQDNIRDLFFTESGWVVIRFTEKQVHIYQKECVDFIQNVVNSLKEISFNSESKFEKEEQWNENQCIQWQLEKYREEYLEIHSFSKRLNLIEVVVDENEKESIESLISRTPFENIQKKFKDDLHKYFDPAGNDKTGNAEFISVTTLIERFFQFDIMRYIKKKAIDENKSEDEVFSDHLIKTSLAASDGTDLHLQIENYLTKKPHNSSAIEFEYFLNFVNEKIIPKQLIFYKAEKKIYYPKFNIAGTVDCLFKNVDGSYTMVDWKRSKKLIVKGTNKPDKRGFQIDIEGLSNLTNSSYYRYCIQQNIYKIILEQEYNIIISDMILAILHENYPNYHTIKLPVMIEETKIIFNSINHRI